MRSYWPGRSSPSRCRSTSCFPAFSIGLASYLAVLEALWLWTGREVFLNLFNYWLKIFAVAFGMGVVSGIVMSYQFGTNWSVFSDKAGPVIGPLMAYEVLTAFFLEAGFLGVMLFGLKRVGPGLHFLATLMVAIGTLISAFWILSANSWMQTPAGYAINADGQFIAADWLEVIFNPSFPYRLVHMVLAAYLTTALVVGAVGAWHLLRDRAPRRRARDVLDGDVDGGAGGADPDPRRRPARPQHAGAPAGQDHGDGGPFPEPQGRRAADPVRPARPGRRQGRLCGRNPEAGLADPQALARRADGRPRHRAARKLAAGADHVLVVPDHGRHGLADAGARPVQPVDALCSGKLYDSRLLHMFAVAMGPAGFVAVLAGWITTEVGRQPFTVYGLLRTAESASPLAAPAVASSLIAFIIVYFAVFGAGVIYMLRLMAAPPHPGEQGPSQRGPDPRRRHHARRGRGSRGSRPMIADRPSPSSGPSSSPLPCSSMS